jgi:hypothetical protein
MEELGGRVFGIGIGGMGGGSYREERALKGSRVTCVEEGAILSDF